MQSSKDKWVKNGLGHVLRKLEITDYRVIDVSQEDSHNAQYMLDSLYRLQIIDLETLNEVAMDLITIRLSQKYHIKKMKV